MGHHESNGKTDEWYTPKYVFDALDCKFDMDVAAPVGLVFVQTPASVFLTSRSLEMEWRGFVWLNPPFGGRNGIVPWLDKIYQHGSGIALTPDRTSCPWWQETCLRSDAHLQVAGKIKFINQFGDISTKPGNGTTLFAFGDEGVKALLKAQQNGLGTVFKRFESL